MFLSSKNTTFIINYRELWSKHIFFTNVSASQQRPQTTGWLPPCWTNGQIEAMEAPRWRHLWRDGVRPEVEEGTKKTLATVDGINPATPLDWYFIPLFTGFFTSQVVVWDFFSSTVSSEMSRDLSWSCVRCDKRKKRGPTILKISYCNRIQSLHHDPSTLGVLFFKGTEKSVNNWSELATNSNTSNHGHLRPWLVGLLAAPTWPDSALSFQGKRVLYKLWCEMFWNLGILTKS